MAKTKHSQTEKPVWLKYTPEEVKAIITKLAEKGLTSEKIGLVLRDSYGIPKTKLFKFKIGQVLKEKRAYIDSAIKNLNLSLEKQKKHSEKHKQDQKTKRAVTITSAKIKKLKEYNKKKGHVSSD